MKKGLKIRAYPNTQQQQTLAQSFGNVRWFWNYSLNLWNETYSTTGRGLSAKKVQDMLPKLKKQPETDWLKLAPSQSLQIVAKNLGISFDRFFKGIASSPKFKGKHDKQSLSVSNTNVRVVKDNLITFPKLGKLKVIFPDNFDYSNFSFTTFTLSKNKANQYFVSFCIEYEPDKPKQPFRQAIGLDFGLIDFISDSEGNTVKHPKHYQKSEKRKKFLGLAFSRTEKGSKNRSKAALRKNKVEQKIVNQRKDFQHKLSRKLVDENQIVCIEDLAVSNMIKNSKLAKALQQSAWHQFTRVLEYKCFEANRQFVKIGRFYPSSKICNCCGHKRIEKLTLDIREWNCDSCGIKNQRDTNAAKNIKDEGLRTLRLDESWETQVAT